MTIDNPNNENKIILYSTADGSVKVDVFFENETFWLTQKAMAELFDVDVRTISYHLKEIYKSEELTEAATTQNYWIVQKEDNREVKREVAFYSLDAIIPCPSIDVWGVISP